MDTVVGVNCGSMFNSLLSLFCCDTLLTDLLVIANSSRVPPIFNHAKGFRIILVFTRKWRREDRFVAEQIVESDTFWDVVYTRTALWVHSWWGILPYGTKAPKWRGLSAALWATTSSNLAKHCRKRSTRSLLINFHSILIWGDTLEQYRFTDRTSWCLAKTAVLGKFEESQSKRLTSIDDEKKFLKPGIRIHWRPCSGLLEENQPLDWQVSILSTG